MPDAASPPNKIAYGKTCDQNAFFAWYFTSSSATKYTIIGSKMVQKDTKVT